jgi:hypothetical protein
MLASGGVVDSVFAVLDLRKARSLRRAQDWPVVEGSIIHIGEQRDENGCEKVTITYSYTVQNQLYAGSESFTVRQDREAAQFKAAFSDGTIRVHYRPDNPDISVPHLQRAR